MRRFARLRKAANGGLARSPLVSHAAEPLRTREAVSFIQKRIDDLAPVLFHDVEQIIHEELARPGWRSRTVPKFDGDRFDSRTALRPEPSEELGQRRPRAAGDPEHALTGRINHDGRIVMPAMQREFIDRQRAQAVLADRWARGVPPSAR